MSVAFLAAAAERLPLPDRLTRAGIAVLVGRTNRKLARGGGAIERNFAAAMANHPIAVHAAAANAQHYELPSDFFRLILGPRMKYSCCLYDGAATLSAAEERALAETAAHAELADGQRILELGCGWGSLTLWMAERFPSAEIVAVSNSHGQRTFILAEAARRGLRAPTMITADMNGFTIDRRFDRIVSVEMFEHMSNWRALMERIHDWLASDGRAFLHVFSHCSTPYRFDHDDPRDWIAQHFFTGGVMPSHGLVRQLEMPFAIEEEWRWNGDHYRRTAEQWLSNFDANAASVFEILRRVYGNAAGLWMRRWRLFFLATAELFGAAHGKAWGVSHYRLRPR